MVWKSSHIRVQLFMSSILPYVRWALVILKPYMSVNVYPIIIKQRLV